MKNNKSVLARLLLLGATLIWGSSFVIMKTAITGIPIFYLLCFRFLTGAAVVCLLCLKKLSKLNRDYWIRGSIMGIFLFVAYVFQTYGLADTTPGKNAFLTTTYCIIVPFLYWAVAGIRPNRYHVLASVVCVTGIGLISLDGSLSMRLGDILTLICGVFYAAHLVSVSVFSKDRDILLLTMVQFLSAGVLGGICGVLFDTFPTHISGDIMWELAYLCLFATAAALLMQNVGQKYTPPATAAIILSLESVFGALFSILFYHEQVTPRILCGFVLIFLAILISEAKLLFAPKSSLTEEQ